MDNNLLISLAKDEAKRLKTFATKEELERLDFKTLRPYDPSSCIYGQMTGDCYSDRSKYLITNCAEKLYHTELYTGLRQPVLNGEPNFHIHERNLHYSPIEIFIYQEENRDMNNKLLIDYLQGKTTDFVLAVTPNEV